MKQMKKEKLSATNNKEKESRKASFLFYKALKITSPNSQPLVSAQNENPSECLLQQGSTSYYVDIQSPRSRSRSSHPQDSDF